MKLIFLTLLLTSQVFAARTTYLGSMGVEYWQFLADHVNACNVEISIKGTTISLKMKSWIDDITEPNIHGTNKRDIVVPRAEFEDALAYEREYKATVGKKHILVTHVTTPNQRLIKINLSKSSDCSWGGWCAPDLGDSCYLTKGSPSQRPRYIRKADRNPELW